jgi:hypothetical protein
MSSLSAFIKIATFDDPDQTNAPKLQSTNWSRSTLTGIPVDNPGNSKFLLPALATKDVFDGSVQLAYDGTTQFAVSLSTLSASLYRMTFTAGTDPEFRTARVVPVAHGDMTLEVLANQTLTVTHEDGAVFGAVHAGDEVFIPGATTGDTPLFSVLNEGKWTVLDATSTKLTLVRDANEVFSGFAQVVALTADSQFLVFSSTGVQPNDTIVINSGFPVSMCHPYTITKATSTFFEFASSSPLPSQTFIPGLSSFNIYSSAKRFYYLETDQELDVSINGDSVETVTPFQAGSSDFPGVKMASSIVYSLSVTNKSSVAANVRIVTVE